VKIASVTVLHNRDCNYSSYSTIGNERLTKSRRTDDVLNQKELLNAEQVVRLVEIAAHLNLMREQKMLEVVRVLEEVKVFYHPERLNVVHFAEDFAQNSKKIWVNDVESFWRLEFLKYNRYAQSGTLT
jgi:hypothetical protein